MSIVIREVLAARMLAINPKVSDAVVDHFVNDEITRRSNLTIKGLNALTEAELALKKLDKPDILEHNRDGSVAEQRYTKKLIEELKKAEGKIQSITASLEKALDAEKPDYTKLEEVLRGADDQKQDNPGKPGNAAGSN